jgi:hypothetical protein
MINAIVPLSFLICTIFGVIPKPVHSDCSVPAVYLTSDSIGRQILYNGRVWRNLYTDTDDHQFFINSDFIWGSVTIDGYTFDSVSLRFDIYSDELLILKDDGTVVQLNREMIDSFSLIFIDREYSFKNFENDAQGQLTGYCNVLYNGSIKMYVKYMKEILSTSITRGPPKFNQINKIFVIKDGRVYRTDSRKDLLDLFTDEDDKILLKKYIRNNQIRISRSNPESFRQVIEYYEAAKK